MIQNIRNHFDNAHMVRFLTKSPTHPAMVRALSRLSCEWDQMDRAVQKYDKSQKVRNEIPPLLFLQGRRLIHGHLSEWKIKN